MILAAARPIYRLMADALTSLHWLLVPERIEYKLAVLCSGVQGPYLEGAPSYFGLPIRVTDLALRSAGFNRLVVPPVKLSTVGSRAFPVTADQLWNSLLS